MTAVTDSHIIVVGGGIAGLVVARDLVAGGARVTVVEGSDRLGGKVAAHTLGGIETDAGAESFATRRGTVADLVTELGLAGALVLPNTGGAWLQPRTGAALPLPKAGLLGIPSVPLASDVIRIVGLGGALRAQLDALMSGFVGSRERSLGAVVRKRMGRAVLDRLVTPVAGAIHSAHPNDLDVDVVAPRLRTAMLSEGSLAKAVLTLREAAPAGSAVQGLSGGLFQLIDALARELDGRAEIILSAPVAEADAGGASLADGRRLTADRVVVAAELGAQTGTPITLATLVLRAPALDAAPRGTGVLVAAGAAGVGAKALTHATAKWAWLEDRAEGAHVVRLSYEGMPAGRDLREQARADAARLLGVDIAAEAVLAYDRIDWTGPGEAEEASEGVVRVGERVSGAGLAAVVGQARQAAADLLSDLAREPGLGLTDH
nr:FAD-dependent oxidoreductase [Marisediminicola antarctica]